ncbi:MAG TPA: L,D-transpeptidase/peptidoglycan binding protein [Solirubrobacteraceae bacterium]|nr:L,D-transpeptidase/peptidoglycan binding protein [Solirubrobacteraceae bacterium]
MRRSYVIAAAFGLVVAGVLVLAAYLYDSARRDTIAHGVTVGGVDVGGLTRSQASAKLTRDLLDPLSRPIVLRRAARRWHLTAHEAQISADVAGSVDEAIARSRQGNFLGRAVRGLTGSSLNVDLQPRMSYNDHAVVRLLDRVRRAIERKPRNASITFSGAGVEPVPSAAGLLVPASVLHRRIREAILSPTAQRTFTIHMDKVQPKVTTSQLAKKYPTVIIVNRAAFTLRLYKDLRPVKTYTIAVGRQGLETPAGLYDIQDKQVNPSWHVPNSAWAGALAGKVIPPGPDDPIKARWMGIDGGAGIHGVDPSEYGSLGSAASHGCVRMRIPDVINLYDQVSVGTPVYIA